MYNLKRLKFYVPQIKRSKISKAYFSTRNLFVRVSKPSSFPADPKLFSISIQRSLRPPHYQGYRNYRKHGSMPALPIHLGLSWRSGRDVLVVFRSSARCRVNVPSRCVHVSCTMCEMWRGFVWRWLTRVQSMYNNVYSQQILLHLVCLLTQRWEDRA